MITEPIDGRLADDPLRAEPESLRLRELSVALTVADLERSLHFWVEGMGFTVRDHWEDGGAVHGAELVAGKCSFVLRQDAGDPARHSKGVGVRLLAETAQDLDQLAERLRSRGIEPQAPSHEPWAAQALTVVDPDGYELTLYRA